MWLAIWLVYAGHASLWAVAAALLDRPKRLSSAARHTLWKVASLAPLVTTLAATLIVGPLDATAGATPTAVGRALIATPALAIQPHLGARWCDVAAVVVAISIGVGVGRLVLSWVLLRRRLKGRRPVDDPRLSLRLERVLASTSMGRVRLTMSERLDGPLVVGSGEICVPPSLAELPDDEIDAVFAHEVAHLERRDGMWFPTVGALHAILWLQPAGAWVARRMRETAELACDDRALELIADPLSLGRALYRVAKGARGPRLALAPSMAEAGHALLARVARLTDGESARPPRRRPRWLSSSLLVVAGGLSIFRVDIASSAPLPIAHGSNPSVAPDPGHPTTDRPTDETCREDMAELARRDRDLETRWAIALAVPDGRIEGTEAGTVALGLEQELRHVRETAAWMEERCAREDAVDSRRDEVAR